MDLLLDELHFWFAACVVIQESAQPLAHADEHVKSDLEVAGFLPSARGVFERTEPDAVASNGS
jgi:hypothetical protein